MTVAELAARVGDIPLWRVQSDPPPGTGTESDVDRIRRQRGTLCELIDGVLVEKAVSYETAMLALEIGRLLGNFVRPRKLGWVLGADGFVWIQGRHLRAPDVHFTRRDQLPGQRIPASGFPEVAPALVVEVFSPGNTRGEMDLKRKHFFRAGTELFWIVYPRDQQIEVYTDPQTYRILDRDDTLDGGQVLPGFSVKVAELFDAIELAEPDAQNG
jgi:Uma2 family endonuclease